MRLTTFALAAFFNISMSCPVACAEPLPNSVSQEFNTALMMSTFQIVGPSRPVLCGLTNITTGTGFVVSQPYVGARDSDRTITDKNGSTSRLILITAAHVFDHIGGENAILRVRARAEGKWKELDISLPIRKSGKELYVKHAKEDVAVLDLLSVVNFSDLDAIKRSLVVIPMSVLATEKFFDDRELHPGDELSCLGFPLSTATEGNFPVLRGGKIASFPVLPKFFFDFEVFPGNSGGPVYISPQTRTTSRGLDVGGGYAIVGLLSGELQNVQPLKVGFVMASPFVIETINKLPM